MPERNFEKLIDETIESVNGAKRAEARLFLFTRVMALVNKTSPGTNTWARLGTFLSRPGILMCGLILILLLNAGIILAGKNHIGQRVFNKTQDLANDEFAINPTSFYEIENAEEE